MPPINQDSAKFLGWAGTLVRLGLVCGVALGVTGTLAYTGGWLSPAPLTQDRVMAALQTVNGAHSDVPHGKAVCVTGWFKNAGQAVKLSREGKSGRIPLVGRLALAGGMPFRTEPPGTVRGMAVRFLPPGENDWTTGSNDTPVAAGNAAAVPADPLLTAALDPATGKPDPEKIRAFLTAHPEIVRALTIIAKRRMASEYASSEPNAFRFVDAAGQIIPVPWRTVPVQPFEPAGPAVKTDQYALFDDMVNLIAQHPPQWQTVVTVGAGGDPAADATVPWLSNRPQIDPGMVTIDQAEGRDTLPCDTIINHPTVLRAGIEPSRDLPPSTRSSRYARSFTLGTQANDEKPLGTVGLRPVSHADGPS